MSCWLTIPSARPPEQVEPVLAKWRAQGYKIALYCDPKPDEIKAKSRMADHITVTEKYPGYAVAVNTLIAKALMLVPDAEWFIAAGDDTFPDSNHKAEEIAAELKEHFRVDFFRTPTFGCMQPTGDPWRDVQGRIIERIAGSAWLGREFCKRINQGNGPLWSEYTHCFVDEELQCVAQKYGVFWQRPDLIHHHDHWARKNGDVRDMPAHLIEANSAAHWEKYKGIFTARKAAGFPGSEPL